MLDTYHSCIDSCVGNWELLREKLLESGGFGIQDCLDAYYPRFRPSGSLESSKWSKITAYRTFIVLQNSGVLSKFSNDDLTLISHTIANCGVLASMSRPSLAGQTLWWRARKRRGKVKRVW